MGAARDSLRVKYSRARDMPAATRAFMEQVEAGEFDGKYYRVVASVTEGEDGRIRIKAVSQSDVLEVGLMRFKMSGGESEIEWVNSDPDED